MGLRDSERDIVVNLRLLVLSIYKTVNPLRFSRTTISMVYIALSENEKERASDREFYGWKSFVYE